MYLYPMFATVFYIFAIGIIAFRVRTKAVREKHLSAGYFKNHDQKSYEVPERIVRFGRHLDNQFQVPVVFLVTMLAAGTYSPKNTWIAGLAWAFLASRLLHSWIHLGSNHILFRARAYLLGWILIFGIWVVILSHQSV